jgi:hypothetical protein
MWRLETINQVQNIIEKTYEVDELKEGKDEEFWDWFLVYFVSIIGPRGAGD